MKYRTLTPSAVFPCTVAFLKDQLRSTHDALDVYLESLIAAATEWANGFTGRQINYATLQGYSNYLGNRNFFLDRGPVIAITKIEYLNSEGALVTIIASSYSICKDEYSCAIFLKDDFEFVNLDTTRPDAIQITFTAGYGGVAVGAIAFPEIVKNAVALKAARMFVNPEDGVDEKVSVSENLLKSMRCPIV